MEEKAGGSVRVDSEISHPHTWESMGTWSSSQQMRDRFLWSPEQRRQFMSHVGDGNKPMGGEDMVFLFKGAHTRGSRWASLAPMLH